MSDDRHDTAGTTVDLGRDDLDESCDLDTRFAVVAHWYGCHLASRPNALDHGKGAEDNRVSVMKRLNADYDRLWAVVLGTHPAPPPPPADAPHPAHVGEYLEWLVGADGVCGVEDCPPGIPPEAAAEVRRHLLERGLLAATHYASAVSTGGGRVETTGYALTAAGWDAADPPRRVG